MKNIEALVSIPTLIAAMPIGFLHIDPFNTILDVNSAAEEMLARSRQAIIARNCLDLFPFLAGTLECFWRDRTRTYRDDLVFDNNQYHVNVVFHEGGAAIFLTLKPSRAYHTPSENSAPSIAAILAHELKNPLAGIRGAAQLLESKLNDKDRLLADLIKKESDRIALLIDSYGEWGSKEQSEILNINEVLDHSVQVARHGFAEGITLDVSFDPSLPEIEGKKNQLIQAILNLLKNASEAGNRIHLRSHYAWGPLLAQPGKNRQRLGLAIDVEDNGPGVPQELLSRIFDPFISSKRGNRGLGLAQVRQTALDHLGTIEYHRAPTLFRMTLPISLSRRDV